MRLSATNVFSIVAATFVFLAHVSLAAADPLGTAGSFRSFGWAHCGAPILEQMRGACDPPSVAKSLSGSDLAEAHLKRAIALVSFLRMTEARTEVDQALKADPELVDALVFRARLSASQMDADSASRDLAAGLLLAGDNPYLRATRAEMLLENGDARGALSGQPRVLQTATKLPPEVLQPCGRQLGVPDRVLNHRISSPANGGSNSKGCWIELATSSPTTRAENEACSTARRPCPDCVHRICVLARSEGKARR